MTLPALPLHIGSLGLPDRQSLKLALCWLRGGDWGDYSSLEVSDSVLVSMLLQAAMDNHHAYRRDVIALAATQAWDAGFNEGMAVAALL